MPMTTTMRAGLFRHEAWGASKFVMERNNARIIDGQTPEIFIALQENIEQLCYSKTLLSVVLMDKWWGPHM